MPVSQRLAQLMNEESEYERARRERIKENEEMLKKLFPDGPVKFSVTPKVQQNPRTLKARSEGVVKARRRSKLSDFTPVRKNPSRSCRQLKRRCYDSDVDEDDEKVDDRANNQTREGGRSARRGGGGGLIVKLPGMKTLTSTPVENYCNSDDEEYELPSPKKRRKQYFANVRPFDAVTTEDLILVAMRTSEKTYDSENGTTCHQCRQKTDDLKTVCRSESCFGVRGQFCGPCLKNRYGEDAKKAIMDPEWMCPPCRGICNCSFCMKKRGRRATGIMIHLAKDQGFNDVKSFLGD